ncbi:MAG: thiamine phosphate synthase [Methylotenera sp.]|nr:thiamine phosphate synthase [Methylotenera sp.]MDO9233323.1 thiamine phosphate synthase [Methylotenera sp.]MDO9389749.1 thiamine phosphate synthase [Methylotenera sp.]MDP2403051.1 thiamine phosphate synthase [Methylotenera sp.]MDP3096094.1 thiamine phosphate synthase [Methylotenera sp.]
MITGLYAITPDEQNTDVLVAKVEAALQGGIKMLQYRNKLANYKLQTQQARALLPLCRQYHVPLIINDSIELCLMLDADGVHLGADDGNLSEARAKLCANKIMGASCYNRFDLALSAQQAGADYVAFGACFTSSTKPHAPVAGLELFTRAKSELTIPTIAIGGITLENASSMISAGANAIAVINAIFSADDVKLTTQQFTKLFIL